MKTFDFMWPENLECEKFPVHGSEEICISNNATSKSDQSSYSTPVSVLHKHDRNKNSNGLVDYKSNVTGYSHRSIGFICPVQLKAPQVMGYELNVAGKPIKDCGAPCNSLFFDESDRTKLRYWISSWAAISVASCLFTVNSEMFVQNFRLTYSFQQILTFIIDSSRFRYPERPIVFLAICYLLVGCAYVSGLGAGDSVACREPFQPHARLGRLQMISTITQVKKIFNDIWNWFLVTRNFFRRVTGNQHLAQFYSWHCIFAQWLRLLGGCA